MPGQGERVFRRGVHLAVLADTEDDGHQFWLCSTTAEVFSQHDSFTVVWLEKLEDTPELFTKTGHRDKISFGSVVTRVTLLRVQASDDGRGRRTTFRLPEKENKKVESLLGRIKNGLQLSLEGAKVLEEKVEKSGEKPKAERKRKIEPNKKGEKVTKKKKKNDSKVKKIKTSKAAVVDKTNPNWRLKPNPAITVWEKDPLFETKEKVPFVSSLAQSKLAIRAVLVSDLKLLEQVVKDDKKVHDPNIKRSLGNNMSALSYALKTENLEAVRILLKTKMTKPRAELPSCSLTTSDTGTYNYRSLGIRNVHRLNMSRGGKEGNNAFTRDQHVELSDELEKPREVLRWNVSRKFLHELKTKLKLDWRLEASIVEAVRFGNRELAAHLIEKDVRRGGSSFSKFYSAALVGRGDPWDGTIKEVSVNKKADYSNKQMTPLHCACINPDTGPLEAMFRVSPNLAQSDLDQRKLVHYAAACTEVGPLAFLWEAGANLEDKDREGRTPLMTACQVGREETANFIIEKLGGRETDQAVVLKFGVGGVDMPGRDSWGPLHIAVAHQNYAVVKLLLKHGATPDKPLSTKYDKMSALMLAAANGDLAMVKLLVENRAKVEKPDRYKKTALTHAVINGAANVASYLLSLGADPNKPDSSSNTNLHYACAYGWWFCMKILISAGAVLDALNSWRFTPLGLSIMKGHKGIADYLIQLPGIDINMKDDHGRTVLMNMMVDKTSYTLQQVEEIRMLVEVHGADCHLRDNSGQNILHQLASPRITNCDKKSDLISQWNIINDLADFFLRKGVSPLEKDRDGAVPLVSALRTSVSLDSVDSLSLKNKNLIDLLIRQMEITLNDGQTSIEEKDAEEIIAKIMEAFVSNIELCSVSDDLEQFKDIVNLIKLMLSLKMIESTGFLDRVDDSLSGSLTLFELLCRTFTKKSQGQLSTDANISTYCEILELFIKEFSPSFTVKSQDEKREDFHVLLHLADPAHQRNNFAGLGRVVQFSQTVDVMDRQGRTPLIAMIESQRVEHMETLVGRGAEVNRINITRVNSRERARLPIERALQTENIQVTACLLERGAVRATFPVTGSSLIHQAVSQCARKKNRNNLEMVKLILARHHSLLTLTAHHQMTPLHVAVCEGVDDADNSLDLETFLIRSGADVNATDEFNRTPLHYAFVSNNDRPDTGQSDPIQVVSLLVEAMETDKIHQTDLHGCTALHYAALRGATVCSLLLIQRGAEVNCLDKRGNSPLANAVLGKHQSCALMLVQREANINVTINKTDSSQDTQTGQQFFRFLPEHFRTRKDCVEVTVFEGLVTNNWLGLTYIALEKLELFGFSLAKAVEVAFKLGKFQFAKTLLGKALDNQKLQEILAMKRNLLSCLCFWCGGNPDGDLIRDIFEILTEAGLRPTLTDEFLCSPLHYAALNRNRRLVELLLSQPGVRETINEEDKYGRTPLAAFFYNYTGGGDVEREEEEEDGLLDVMLDCGARVDTLFPCRPLDLLQGQFQASQAATEYLAGPGSETRLTALMVAVVVRDVRLARYLLARGADLNTADSQGRTAVMLAVKTRHQPLVDLILGHRGQIDLSRRDNRGHGILEHAVALSPEEETSPTFTDVEMMKNILKLNFDKESLARALRLAQSLGSQFSGTILGSKDQKTSRGPSRIKTIHGNQPGHFDHREDSVQMMERMEKQLSEVLMEEEEKVEKPSGCVVKDGTIYQDYDVLLNKVDVDFGKFGMYNFYRLQVWKEKHQELYILFTNWGRIERWGRGQYQNTPYSTAEEAVAEFCKIFKSKSGNDWQDRENFVDKNRKYRIVQTRFQSKVKKESFEINLLTEVRSRLPLALQKFVADISDVKMLKQSYWKEKICDSGNIPFEQIDREALSKAEDILDEIQPLIEKKDKLDKERADNLDLEEDKTKSILAEMGQILQRISALSNEYYFLVPSADFSFEKVPPVDSDKIMKQEQNRIKQLTEIELSKSVVLGSMLRKDEIHPLDYIFHSLKCNIEMLEENSLETQLILQYLYNSRGMRSIKVEQIFKIQREGDGEKHQTGLGGLEDSRKLLWHGTSVANLISILTRGLKVHPPYGAARTGRSFGDGVYFADVCDKSRSYASPDYILLCDVQLADMKEITYWGQSNEDIGKNSSLFVRGSNCPDEKSNIKTYEGHIIPAGKIVKEKQTSRQSYSNYSEYIVKREENIMVRYIVKFGDGTKKYSGKDLHMKAGEEDEDDPMDGNSSPENDSDSSEDEDVFHC